MSEDLGSHNDADRAQLVEKNKALAASLAKAAAQLAQAKSQLLQIAEPPLSMATLLHVESARTDDQGVQRATLEVAAPGRHLIVPLAPDVSVAQLTPGCTVLMNQDQVVVAVHDAECVGHVRVVDHVLDGGRLVVADASGQTQIVLLAPSLVSADLSKGDRVLIDPSSRLALQALPNTDDDDLVLEQTPDVTFDDIGGLDAQIGRIRDAVQLPFQHRELFTRYELKALPGMAKPSSPRRWRMRSRMGPARAVAAYSSRSKAPNCSTSSSVSPSGSSG